MLLISSGMVVNKRISLLYYTSMPFCYKVTNEFGRMEDFAQLWKSQGEKIP